MLRPVKALIAVGLLAIASCAAVFGAPPLGQRLVEDYRRESLVIDPQPIMRTAAWLWDNASEREWMGCVHGELVGDTVRFTGIELADMVSSDSVSASGRCRDADSVVGRLHAHNQEYLTMAARCGQSMTDWENFHGQPDWAYDLVLCDRELLWISIEKLPLSRIVAGDSVALDGR